jgi:hypothetical protein
MKYGGITFDEDVLSGKKPPTEKQLRFLATKLVKEWHRIREECEAKLEYYNSVGQSHRVTEYERLLQEIRDNEADILGSAQWARRMLREREERK